jgi:serine/threonine protein phosphatase PrpC
MPANEVDTAEFEAPSDQAGKDVLQGATALVQVDVAGCSHQGHVRTVNEDQFYIARADRVLQTLATSLPHEQVAQRVAESAFGMIVADGIGGAAAGEVASQTAIASLMDHVLTTPDWIMRYDESLAQRWQDRFRERFHQAHAAVQEAAAREPELAGMGTTLTVACSSGRHLLIAHLGDSRVYLFRQQELRQLTHDHTLAQELVDRGQIASTESAAPRLRHSLTRAIGGWGQEKQADVQLSTLDNGDCLLLCTDGLTDMVDDATIADILGQNGSSTAATQAFIDTALAGGGRDNVTVVVARYRIPDQVG